MTALFEGIAIAVSSLRASKVRAALTIVGVAIGVAVVMVMASMVRGINNGVGDMLEQLGPRTFFVFRAFQGGVVISDGSDSPWRRNPPIVEEEAGRLERVPTVLTVVLQAQSNTSVDYGSSSLSSVSVNGNSWGWVDMSGGDISPGRSFTRFEDLSRDRVAVVNRPLADELFGLLDPIGKEIRVGGEQFRVIGVHNPPPDIFGGGNQPTITVPFYTMDKYLRYWRGGLNLLVKPIDDIPVADAIEDVTAALRSFRGLKPGDDNNFAVITQDRLLENWNQVTGMFFLVMIVLSSVGLMVGGVGVVAIMMISVTERTREIGVRKALGARRREILWQFLVEAATLTAIGGMVGMAIGGGISVLVNNLSPIPAVVPAWSIVVALGASVLTGIGFGLYPAARAARMNPVDALRYE